MNIIIPGIQRVHFLCSCSVGMPKCNFRHYPDRKFKMLVNNMFKDLVIGNGKKWLLVLGCFLVVYFLDVSSSFADVFDSYLEAPYPPADGFDFPVGNIDGKGSYVDLVDSKEHQGWYIAVGFNEKYSLGIHPGEDWNGRGGGNTDLGQPVRAIANGKVVFAEHCGVLWGNVVVLEHIYYENHQKLRIQSLYVHLNQIRISLGDIVKRRKAIGTIGRDPGGLYFAHLHLELRSNLQLPATYWPTSEGKDQAWVRKNYIAPSKFIETHRKLFVPQKEETLIIVDHQSQKAGLVKKGKKISVYDIGFGQAAGRKRIQGDLKTPKGMYFVTYKHRGEFSGKWAEFYGGHWIKINYPNVYDAKWGLDNKKITGQQKTAIDKHWSQRKNTSQNTRLGGGIGFHGWIEEWANDGDRYLSWGCVVMHNRDIKKMFSEIPLGTMVVIF